MYCTFLRREVRHFTSSSYPIAKSSADLQSKPRCRRIPSPCMATGQTKELTELVPGILNQLGPDSLANLRRLAESYQTMTARQAAAAAAAGGASEKKEGEVGDDDEIPDLVENFEEAGEEKKAPSGLEELE